MITKHDLLKKLAEIDRYEFVLEITDDISCEDMLNFSEKHIAQDKRAILGLDIYKYSEYDDKKQPLIPFIFDLLLDNCFELALNIETSLFKGINIRENFISTGDGGFIIFPTPIHALAFNLCFFSVLHVFNCGHFSPKLSKYIGGLTIRSTITFDNVFNYEGNWYGKAIIKNARILSKDRLNRFTIDDETYNYFMRKFNGIESLSIIDPDVFKQTMGIKDDLISELFDGRFKNVLRNIHIQKIEDKLAKSTLLNIYNIEIQLVSAPKINGKTMPYIFTLGNTNDADIE